MGQHLCQITLIGAVTNEAELKMTPSGTAILKFNMVVNKRKKVDNSWKDEPHFYRVKIIGKFAETMEKKILKGREYFVVGEMLNNRYKDKEDKMQDWWEIIASSVGRVGFINKEGEGNTGNSNRGGNSSHDEGGGQEYGRQPSAQGGGYDDDIPF